MKELDYNKPICATSGETLSTHILLPRMEGKCYSTVGYDWFDITLGDWNSCAWWKTKEEAVQHYKDWNYTVRNCELKVGVL